MSSAQAQLANARTLLDLDRAAMVRPVASAFIRSLAQVRTAQHRFERQLELLVDGLVNRQLDRLEEISGTEAFREEVRVFSRDMRVVARLAPRVVNGARQRLARVEALHVQAPPRHSVLPRE